MIKFQTILPDRFHADITIREKILDYLEQNELTIPESFRIIEVAQDENGDIVGVSALASIVIIEPLKADTPMIGHVLFQRASAIFESFGIDGYLRALTKNESVVNQLKKLGFEEEKNSLTMLRR